MCTSVYRDRNWMLNCHFIRFSGNSLLKILCEIEGWEEKVNDLKQSSCSSEVQSRWLPLNLSVVQSSLSMQAQAPCSGGTCLIHARLQTGFPETHLSFNTGNCKCLRG